MIVFATGHTLSVFRAAGSSEVYCRAWAKLFDAAEYADLCDIRERDA